MSLPDAEVVGSMAWRSGLAAGTSTGFRFDGQTGKFSARREARRLSGYWYAYRKSGGKLHKVYLGRSAELTLDRLETVAATLDAVARAGSVVSNQAARLEAPRKSDGASRQVARAQLDSSYQRLSEPERQLLAIVAVFEGGFDLNAVTAVCASDPRGEPVADSLARLLESSLLLDEPPRYRLLETTRAYAADRLHASGRSSTYRARHADWCLTVAEQAQLFLRGTDQADWLSRLELDHDNLRVALAWTLEHASSEYAERFGLALWRFWYIRGHYAEGRRWLSALLAVTAATQPTSGRAVMLFGLGQLAFEQGDLVAARQAAEMARGLGQQLEDGLAEAAALTLLGHIACDGAEHAQARDYYQQGLDIRETSPNRADVAISLGGLGHVALARADYAKARVHYGRALAIDRELGQHKDTASVLHRLGQMAYEEGALSEARQHYREGLVVAQSIGDRQRIAAIIEGFAVLAGTERQPGRALTLAGAAASLRSAIRSPFSALDAVRYEARLAASRDALGSQAARWFDHGYRLTVVAAILLALAPSEQLVRGATPPAVARELSAREQDVAAHVSGGLSNRRIAEQLGIARSTVQSHVGNIMSKLALQSRLQLALWYIGHQPDHS